MDQGFPRKVYKYISDASPYFLDAIEMAICNQKFWFSSFSSLDDPSERTLIFEPTPHAHLSALTAKVLEQIAAYRRLGFQRFTEFDFDEVEAICRHHARHLDRWIAERYFEIARETSVYCVSELWNSSVLWASYANSHRGVCLEIDYSGPYHPLPRQDGEVEGSPPWQVFYRDAPPKMTAERAFQFTNDAIATAYSGLVSRDVVLRLALFVRDVFCTKDVQWDFQKEWRSATHEHPSGYYVIPAYKVSSVMFGQACLPATVHNVRSCFGREVDYFKVFQASNSYEFAKMPL